MRGNPPTREAARNNVMTRIALERQRQIGNWGDTPISLGMRRCLLVEAVGSVRVDDDDTQLLKDLVQVAAVALCWGEDLLLEMER